MPKWLDRADEWNRLSREANDPWIKSCLAGNAEQAERMAKFFGEKREPMSLEEGYAALAADPEYQQFDSARRLRRGFLGPYESPEYFI